MDRIIAGMATMPGREDSLPIAINSLRDQVDELHVYLNTPSGEMLEIRETFSSDTVKFHTGPDLKCTGKFYPFFSDKIDMRGAYYIGTDDDLRYPVDYVSRLIQGIEQYDRGALCAFHGRLIHPPVTSYYLKLKEEQEYFNKIKLGIDPGDGYAFPCLKTVEENVCTTVVGTGVSGWHTDLFSLSEGDFANPNMEDIYLSKKANDIKAPRYVLAHKHGWIEHIDHEWTIARAHPPGSDNIQTELFNSIKWQ